MQTTVCSWAKTHRHTSRVIDVSYVKVQPKITDLRMEIQIWIDTRTMTQGGISFIGTVDGMPNQELATLRPFVVVLESGHIEALVHCKKYIHLMSKFVDYTEMKFTYTEKSMC